MRNQKLKVFWKKHKETIISTAVGLGGCIVASGVIAVMIKKRTKNDGLLEDMFNDLLKVRSKSEFALTFYSDENADSFWTMADLGNLGKKFIEDPGSILNLKDDDQITGVLIMGKQKE